MTQQEQQEFTESLEVALSWMRTIQERLRANDNTQGPREALEARLRETEKIHQSEHEGRVKMDMALAAAENLLQSGDEELINYAHVKLKDLKNLWEETCTYIIHCHSRIEWVWLHWSEYLKAYEEFELWLARRQRSLDVRVELQLGVKEKLWQVDQQRILVSDIHSQTTLLERLLDEAAALYNRTQDPSVEPQAQEQLQETYNTVRDRAEERLTLLQKIAEEHQTYQSCVQKFQSWLLSKTKELTELMEREDTAENKLKALQVLDDNVANEEKTLQHIESVAEAVRGNTSPAGAGLVVEEAEELRLGWQRLRQGLCEAEEGLRSSLDSHSQYMTRCQRLGEDISRLRILMQRLDQELEERQESTDHSNSTEDQVVGQWKTYRSVKNTLDGEESQVELLKAQLKELFRFSEDSRHLSDDVLAVVKEHQSVKCRATRLCSESQSELKNILQDPLLVYAQWSHMVSVVLAASAEVNDFSHIAMLVQKIEHLLKDSVELQERFSLLQIRGDLLESVFGPERSDGLQDELSTAIRNRELLHTQLLQRKSRLQGLIARIKDFDEAYDLIVCKLDGLQNRLLAANSHQPDILAKKSQCDQLGVILKDLQDSEAHIIALETLVSSSQNNRNQFEKLYADWKHLHKAVQVKVHENEESIEEHESFHESLLNIEKWLMIVKQKLESFRSPSGEWIIEGRQHEAERALGEFPEKELQLQAMESQGQRVLQKTSAEGQVHILRDLKRLQQSWLVLHNMSLHLHGLLSCSKEQRDSDLRRVGGQHADNMSVITEGDSQVISTSVDNQSTGGQQPEKPTDQDHSEELLLGGQNNESLSLSNSGVLSSKGDQVDTSIYRRAGRKVSKDSTTDRNLDSDKSSEDSSSVLAADREETVFNSMISHSEEGMLGSAEGSMHSGKDTRPGRGAFTLFRRDPAKQPSAPPAQHTMGGSGQYMSRWREFEAWLSQQSETLSGILNAKEAGLSEKELKTRQDTLKGLRAGVAWGQEQFQLLLQESLVSGSDSRIQEDIEDLRYRWMLHKSKLKDVGDVTFRRSAKRIQAKEEELPIKAKTQKRAGLLQRVCRLALPLWLFLLALLLLAFLLPLMDEGNSCSLSNNFARSFNIMLRYNGPPPT